MNMQVSEEFELLTLSAQLEHLTQALDSEPAIELIKLCGPIRDPAPLAWLSRQLLERGWFASASNQEWFADFLVTLPETTVDKILKSISQQPLSEENRSALCQLLLKALSVVPIKALSSMCLLDRSMKHHFPDERDAHLNSIFNDIEGLLNQQEPHTIPLALLAQMSATAIIKLEQTASRIGDSCLTSFTSIRKKLAAEAIQVLEDAPKAVSQANAEDLLARRVYTDPGHFLIELLQNAEDSGAKTWRVIFDEDKLIVWHDGTPFDTRDLVGITSIGQTTKRKQQIGFFGVGFKSVYEVTDRPQIYSDVFCFEIADVSIPKLLAHRPQYLPPGGTAVVLPLRKNLDEERSPKSLYQKAAALDSCVLLTLRSIEVIDLQLTDAGGGPQKHALIECAGEAGTTIKHEPSGNIVAYAIQDDEYSYTGAAREPGRPDKTKVMVGILLEEEGRSTPLPPGAAEVYSYLPTREQPGLRFFVQGHFDVPVDRERIAPDSVWNRWIISQVPNQIARLAERIAKDKNHAAASAFLEVLPLKRELSNAPFSQIPNGLPLALKEIAFVPVTGGKLSKPSRVSVAAPSIVQLFSDDELDENRSFLSPELSERHQELTLELGAEQFGTPVLLSYLEKRLMEQNSSFNFLQHTEKLEQLYDLLLTELEARERQNDPDQVESWLRRLEALPVIPDSSGKLRSASGVSRGSTLMRRIYGDSKHFVVQDLEIGSSRTTTFLDRINVRKIDLEYLISDLEANIGDLEEPLKLPCPHFPHNESCLSTILEALTSADWNLLERVGRLPIFRSADKKYYPAANTGSDLKGVLDASGSNLSKDLAKFYGTARPIASPDAEASQLVLQRLGTPGLTLLVLAQDLHDGLFEKDTLHDLHALLETHADEIFDKVSKQFIQLAIWPDQHGTARPLIGEERVFIANDSTICEIFPDAPFLDPEIAKRKHVAGMAIAPVAVSQVIDGLTTDSQAPLSIDSNSAAIERALAYILDRAQNVDSPGIKTLREKALFLSDHGEALPLTSLSRADTKELRALYSDSTIRNFIDENGSSWPVVTELGLQSSLLALNVETLADDLEADIEADQSLRQSDTGYRAVLVYLAKRVDQMTRPLMLRFTKMAIFQDTTGDTGTLSTDRIDRSPKFVYPCSQSFRRILSNTGIRLLNPELENIIRPLIIAAKVPEAGFEILVDWLLENEVSAEETLDLIQDLFVTRKYELQDIYPPGDRVSKPNQTLNKLKIWKTLSGENRGAMDIMGGNLAELFEPGTAEFDDLQRACVKPVTLKRLQALAPLMIPISPEDFLSDLIKRNAKTDQPLSEQPYFLSEIQRVIRLYEVVGNRNRLELPSVDAAGNLTFSELYYTDADTLAILADLPILKQVLHPELTSYFELGKDEPSKLGNIRNQVAKLWNKMISTRGFKDFERLPPIMVISALGSDLDANKRQRFYKWLITNKALVFDDKACVMKLIEAPLFLTKQGNMVKPGDLVFDEDFPDLGIDWLPSPEIPKPLLETMQIHLDLGRPNVDEIIRRHVVPAYEAATESGDTHQAGRLFVWMARRLNNRSDGDVKRLLKGKNSQLVKLEDNEGRFCLPQELVLPAPEIRLAVRELWQELPQPSEARYPEEIHSFLHAMGVSTSPSLELMTAKLNSITSRKQSLAFAKIACFLRHESGESVYKKLPTLRISSWLLDADGAMKAPCGLYIKSYEIETLVGPFADLYLDKEEEGLLGPTLIKDLGFKDIDEISASEVMYHIEHRAKNKEQVSQRVYSWLDQAAAHGSLKQADVERHFGDSPWILTDDGEYVSHKKVLGTRTFHLYGNLRGYWTHGWKQYSALCKVLGIKDGTSPYSVQAFVEEIGKEVAAEGAKALLKREPALPVMLVNCFVALSKKGITISRELPVIPAIHKQVTDLLPASTAGLYWSDTLTLEALFANVGKLHLARRGTGEDADEVDAFYTAMGIRRLRDAYTVIAKKREGSDRSTQMSEQILSLRSVLRALVATIPRIQLERELNQDTTWVYQKHLKSLAAAGSIKAIEHLRVHYHLPGVGETEVERPAVYDTERGELLIDTKVLADPDLTGLSEGLIPSIIEGPSAESFVDLFEILLARRTQENMGAYLNRRHFAEANVALTEVDRITHRIGELLDYGLTDKLAKRFSKIKEADLSKWREPLLIKEIENSAAGDIDQTAATAVTILLKAIGVATSEPELDALLKQLLLAPSISDCSALLVVGKTEPLKESEQVRRNKSESEESKDTAAPSSAPPPATTSGTTPPATVSSAAMASKMKQPSPVQEGIQNFLEHYIFGKGRNSSPGLAREDQQPRFEEPELPDWLLGNYFRPSKVISSQIWHTPNNTNCIESMKKEAYLHFSPGKLPAPHLYAVNKLGISFNPVLQSWTFGRSAQKFFLTPGESSGRVVSFSGQFYAGKSRLPLPLYSKLAGPVEVSNGSLRSISHDEFGAVVDLAGNDLVSIKYDVEILTVPHLASEQSTVFPADKALVSPTVPLSSLPERVQEWLHEMSTSDLSDSKRALAAQNFVRNNYQYDANFLDREDVKHKRATLRFISGNHHLELLHASGDDTVLGRGVCYELNVLLVELLRHMHIPSCIACGWVLDEGVVDLCDHLFALALVHSDDGDCILPLDASATDRGPIRTVRRRQFPPQAKDLPPRPSVPTVKGSWNITPKNPAPSSGPTVEGGVAYVDFEKRERAHKPVEKPKEESGISRFFNGLFADEKKSDKSSKDSPSEMTVAKSTLDARLSEERKLRRLTEQKLVIEQLERQRSETRLGEERKLRKRAEERLAKLENPLVDLEEEAENERKEKDRKAREQEFRITEPKRQAEEFQTLQKAYDLTTYALGLEAGAYPLGTEGLRKKLVKLLGSTATMETLLRVLRGEITDTSELTPEMKYLEELRIIEFETIPTIHIHLIDPNEESNE